MSEESVPSWDGADVERGGNAGVAACIRRNYTGDTVLTAVVEEYDGERFSCLVIAFESGRTLRIRCEDSYCSLEALA